MPAIITTSSALVYGSYENIFLLLFFIITIILHLQYSVHTKYLPHGVCVCAGGGGGGGGWEKGTRVSASWSPSLSGFCGLIFH